MTATNTTHLAEVLDSALSLGVAKQWWPTLYEPETIAFGSAHGMTLAHTLFHTDGTGVLDHKDTSLLITTLLACSRTGVGRTRRRMGQVMHYAHCRQT